MSSFCKITCGKNPGGTQRNATYILREKACKEWETRNIDESKKLGIEDKEMKRSIGEYLGEYSEQGRGTRRDYRAVLSFKGQISTEKALEMAREFLEKSHFKECPAILAVHGNTKNVHVHILAAARQLDGKKLDLSNSQYKSFDKTWAKIHDRHLERGAELEHLKKTNEKEAAKRAFAQGITKDPLPRPRFTIQMLKIRERLEKVKEKVKDFARAIGEKVRGIFKKPERELEQQTGKNYKRGQVCDDKKWRDFLERSKAGLIPDRGKSPQVVQIERGARQNLGQRFTHDGTYHNLDGARGFAFNQNDYGKDLYFIPNQGETQEILEKGKKDYERLRDEELKKGLNLNMNKYQFQELEREGKIEKEGNFWKVKETGQEFHLEKSGQSYNLVDRQQHEKSQDRGLDLGLGLGRGR